MRQSYHPQMKLGQVAIEDIRLNPRSRDDIPQVLRGLQWLYINEPVRTAIFTLLEAELQPEIDPQTGRPGMSYWEILVMGVLRLTLNWDYDALHEQVNEHNTIRQMLGHSPMVPHEYGLQTIKDNVRLLTPELLDKINELVVKAGHTLVKKKEGETLKSRIDSFVVETDVHYPTDTNLLWDAMRKVITLIAELSLRCGFSDWRQHDYNLRQVKQHFRKTQLKGRHKNPEQSLTERQKKNQEKKEKQQQDAVQAYLDVCDKYFKKAQTTLEKLSDKELNLIDNALKTEIETYLQHARRQMDQVDRRLLQKEVIPHEEKVFSLFEPHTEWISKGKAGVPVELGVRVCIVEDQYQFILNHQVMRQQTDDQVAVSIVKETQQRFPELHSCSFDKGFHSPANQTQLQEMLPVVALPRKGKLSQKAQEIESSENFQKAKHKHSAVESAINALEVHGLDCCPDHGVDGFERYVSLAVLARNVQRIGAVLKPRDQERAQRKKRKLDRQWERELLAQLT